MSLTGEILRAAPSRRSFLQGAAAAALLSGAVGLPGRVWAADGKVLNVAIIGEADTLDPMMSTKDVVSIVTQHMVETLYTFDGSWNIAPLLAASLPQISEDGLVYKIALRDGVKFHDGSVMTAADVVASLQRWTTVASRGKMVAGSIDAITETGPLEVQITMKSPYSPLLSLLAFSNSAAAIYPKSTLAETIAAPVGTGPYKLGEHVPDQYLRVLRFEGYSSPAGEANGSAGARKQLADEIRFIPVPDPNTRVEGLMAGQFDFADNLPAESYDRLAGADKAEPILIKPFGWPVFAINHKAGLMTNKPIRQAVQAALPIDDMLFAAFGDDKFFLVDGPFYPEGWAWRTEAGVAANFNQNSPAKAAELLKAGNYDGTPLRILTSRQYEFHFKMAEVAKMAFEAAGFKVEMNVVDWATLGQQRNDPALWDIYITHSPFLPEPALTDMYASTSRLGWSNPEKDKILAEFTSVTDPEKRKALFADLQAQNFEDVGFLKIGAFNQLTGQRKGLTGLAKTPWPFFWNAS